MYSSIVRFSSSSCRPLISCLVNATHLSTLSSFSLQTRSTTSLRPTHCHRLPPPYLRVSSSHPSSYSRYSIRTFFTSSEKRSLIDLERRASKNPDDAAAQLAFYKMLVREDPAAVVKRFETDRFASNHASYLVYLQAKAALANTGSHTPASTPPSYSYSPSSNLSSYSQPVSSPWISAQQQSMSNNNQMQSQGGTSPVALLAPEEPIRVRVVSNESGKTFASSLFDGAFRLIMIVGLFTLFVTIVSKQAGIGGLGREGGMVKEYRQAANVPAVKFDDVKGCDEAKAELEEVVAFLRNPEQFSRLGGKMPKGVLLLGPPGTGKTLLAKAVAGEAGVPFFFASGSEFEEMFVGVGARRIRDLFAAAKKKSPAIIFIDEIDSVGSKRQAKDIQAARMSLNELLVQLDGFSESSGIIVIGATNFPKLLDPALMRPGRFDRHVTVPLPDVRGRRQILELYASKVTMADGVNLDTLARGTPGMTGADLFNLVNTAALHAAQLQAHAVNQQDLEWAKDRILMGAERKSHIQTEKEKQTTAFHEGGHAIVAMNVQGAMPIHKATILPRGQSLGMVSMLPEDDMDTHTRQQMLARMAVAMGGRVAEEMIFGRDNVTTGASSDLENATGIARGMVMKYGMAEKAVGLMAFSNQQDVDMMSPELRRAVDDEIKKLLDEAYAKAKSILTEKQADLHSLAQALIKFETLDKDEIIGVLKGVEPKPHLRPTVPSSSRSDKSKPSGSYPLPVISPVPTSGPLVPAPTTTASTSSSNRSPSSPQQSS